MLKRKRDSMKLSVKRLENYSPSFGSFPTTRILARLGNKLPPKEYKQVEKVISEMNPDTLHKLSLGDLVDCDIAVKLKKGKPVKIGLFAIPNLSSAKETYNAARQAFLHDREPQRALYTAITGIENFTPDWLIKNISKVSEGALIRFKKLLPDIKK